MKRPIALIILALIVVGGFFVLGNLDTQDTNTDDERMIVYASSFVLEDFARQIGGDAIVLRDIRGSGEAHAFEPSARTIAEMAQADLFFFIGLGFDPWAERVAASLSAQDVRVVRVSDGIDRIAADPHIWLDPVRANAMIERMRDAFIVVDGAHKESYRARADAYAAALDTLDQEFQATLATCVKNDIIVAHDAYGYLANRYGITTHAIAGYSPENEPSSRRLVDLARLAREKSITYVFSEPGESDDVAQTLAREVGAEVRTLNPIERVAASDREDASYIAFMQDNLATLRVALDCSVEGEQK
jgi:zinc transport system substrate-binding protein